MRWLSLIAVLGGCTLITDPDSFEGEPRDGGTTDADANGIDAPPDTFDTGAMCTEHDLDTLRACVEGRYVACDEDGDGFIPMGSDPGCAELDQERGLPPFDCDGADPARRHGLQQCSMRTTQLLTCIDAIIGVLQGVDAGEIAFRLDELTGIMPPRPNFGSLGLTVLAPGAYDVTYLANCSESSCAQLRRITFRYSPPWSIMAEDDLAPTPMDLRDLRAVASAHAGDEPLFAVANGAQLRTFQGRLMVPVDTIPGTITPFIAIDDRSASGTVAWLEAGSGSLLDLNISVGGTQVSEGIRPINAGIPHPIDLSGSHVVLAGDGGDHLYWAAPPLHEEVGGLCTATRGCPTVLVGGSDPDLVGAPGGPPSIVSTREDDHAIGIFPIRTGLTTSIYAQNLRAGCTDEPGLCTDPYSIIGTQGATGQHDAFSLAGRIFVAYATSDGVNLAMFEEDNFGAPITPSTNIPLFNDGLITGFSRVDAIRIVGRMDEDYLELATLVLGDAPGRGPGLYLSILRVCDPFTR